MAQTNQNGFQVLFTVTPTGATAQPVPTGPKCKLQYSSESIEVAADGRTVKQLFEANADALGYDRNRAVAFRQGNTVIDGGRVAEADRTYVASVTFEQKGSR